MKATIDIDATVYRRLKVEAARRGRTIRDLYRVPHVAAVVALRALLADPRVHATGVAHEVLNEAGDTEDAPGLMDRLIHGDYQQSGATLLTFDRDASSLTGARLLTE